MSSERQTTGRRPISPEGRAAIVAGQRRRWSNPVRRSEHALQAAIVEHVKLRLAPGVFVFAVPNGGLRHAIAGARLKREGVKAGVPDLALVIEGRAHFLELKTERGRLTREQVQRRHEIEAAGGTWACAKGLDAALSQLSEWGAIR